MLLPYPKLSLIIWMLPMHVAKDIVVNRDFVVNKEILN